MTNLALEFAETQCNNFQNLKANLFSTDIFREKFSEKLNKETFSIFYLNIRSLNQNIDKLEDLLGFLKGNFSVILLTETLADETAKNNFLFRIPKYVAIH